MADFKTTLIRQKAEQHRGAKSQQNSRTVSAKSQVPPPAPTAAFDRNRQEQHRKTFNRLRYPVEHIITSNQELLNAQFKHETLTMNAFQKLDPNRVKLFSDGIYRLVKEDNGIVSHIPALVSEE